MPALCFCGAYHSFMSLPQFDVKRDTSGGGDYHIVIRLDRNTLKPIDQPGFPAMRLVIMAGHGACDLAVPGLRYGPDSSYLTFPIMDGILHNRLLGPGWLGSISAC